jgi:hypothetical protein
MFVIVAIACQMEVRLAMPEASAPVPLPCRLSLRHQPLFVTVLSCYTALIINCDLGLLVSNGVTITKTVGATARHGGGVTVSCCPKQEMGSVTAPYTLTNSTAWVSK